MTAVSKWCIQTNLQALEILSEARWALLCCFDHLWPVEGNVIPCLLTMDGPCPKQREVKTDLCPSWHKCEWSLEMKPTQVGSRKPCWDSSAFGATRHTLVLSYYTWFTVRGPLLFLCMVLSSSSRACVVCPSAGTLSPQSQPIKVAAWWSHFCHWA